MTAVLEIEGLRKHYAGLRPLRVQQLSVASGERVAVDGFDGPAAELLVNLVTGATLPDEGVVRTFGRSTAEIASGDEWLASLDRFGIVSDRAVLLEASTLAQNLAMPFTLEIDPVAPHTLATVTALAGDCGISVEWLTATGGRRSAGNPGASAPGESRGDGAAAARARAPDCLGCRGRSPPTGEGHRPRLRAA